MRVLWMERREDATGVSGVGAVAEVVEFSNGKCVVAWLSEYQSVAVYDSMRDVEAIHGHDGKTQFLVVWNDVGPEEAQCD